MKQIAVILSVLLFALAGCTSEADDNSLSSLVVILDNQTENVSRSYEEKAAMEEGDVVSFFSRGGVEADNISLTCQGNQWEPETDLQWNTSGEPASVRAYYPAFTTESQDYYNADGHLKDVLHARKQTAYRQPIILGFTHLFAKVTFEANETLHAKMKSISFTPSVRLESINPSDGTLSLTESPAPTVSFEKQDNRTYTFLVPPVDNLSIEIHIQTTEGEQTLTTSAQTFASGQQYTYQLISKKEEVGIFTAEDFIAFSYLINNMPYEGRTLDEFGREENGKMTYYLCADISFTEEQSARVQPIGYRKDIGYGRESMSFNNHFDGQGHTLSQLNIITPKNTYHQGLFGYIGENGVVKNLTLNNCSYSNTSTNSKQFWIGLISGLNKGTITNCHVKSGEIRDNNSGHIGGLVGMNEGNILNSSVEHVTIEGSNNLTVGGLCYDNRQCAINCYIASCIFPPSSISGGMCYTTSTNCKLINCYTYNINFNEYSNAEAVINIESIGDNVIIESCYYEENSSVPNTAKIGTYHTYDSNFNVTETGLTLTEALNNWIDQHQDKYNFSFSRWETDPTGRPIFTKQSMDF